MISTIFTMALAGASAIPTGATVRNGSDRRDRSGRHTAAAMIVDCAVYEQGRRRDGPGLARGGVRSLPARRRVRVARPVRAERRRSSTRVEAEFGLHPLAVEDAVNAHQRPKLEVYDDTLFFVLKPVRYIDPDEVVEIGEILLFVNPAFVISVRHGEPSPLQAVRARLEREPELVARGPGAVLYAIVDRVVDDYEPVVEGARRRHPARSRSRSSQRRPAQPGRADLLPRARGARLPPRGRAAGARASSGSRAVHFERDRPGAAAATSATSTTTCCASSRRSSGSGSCSPPRCGANLTQISVRQNEDMRRITAWVAILAVPTAVAGIYGMNFEHMPELKSEFGYPAVLAVILIVCVVLYRRFKRAGWL